MKLADHAHELLLEAVYPYVIFKGHQYLSEIPRIMSRTCPLPVTLNRLFTLLVPPFSPLCNGGNGSTYLKGCCWVYNALRTFQPLLFLTCSPLVSDLILSSSLLSFLSIFQLVNSLMFGPPRSPPALAVPLVYSGLPLVVK